MKVGDLVLMNGEMRWVPDAGIATIPAR